MVEDILLENLRIVGLLLSATLIPLATLILGRKILKEKKSTGNFNNISLNKNKFKSYIQTDKLRKKN